tara:strand:+ start:1558 stop:2619 length:1062 start_codon:yes stop_codon:yes gene_type:complete
VRFEIFNIKLNMHIFKKFKRSIIWEKILLIIIKPLLDFFWKNILNIHGRILYFAWFSRKRDYIKIKDDDKLLVKNNNSFKDLSHKISNAINDEIINNAEQKILSSNVYETNETNSKKNKYTIDIFNELDDDTKKKVFEFATSKLMVSTAAKYLGIFPILASMRVNYNIPRNMDNPRGAMLWHKDDLGYKSLDLFMAVSDIDDSNGPFHAIKSKNKLGALLKFDADIKNPIRGERSKIKLKNFKKFVNDDDIISLKGKSGLAMFIDSFSCYHRGGHCIKNPRILLRLSYQSVDSIALKQNMNGVLNFYSKITYSSIDNFFTKFLLFKRSKIIKGLNLNMKLLKLYDIINFRHSL